MEERDSLSLIYGFWVGFKSTSLSRPAHWSQNSLHESSVGCLFCFPELNSKAAFPPPPAFPPSLTISTVRKLLGPIAHMERRKDGRKQAIVYHQESWKRGILWAKEEDEKSKDYLHILFHFVFSFCAPKMILTPNRKQPSGLCPFPVSTSNLAKSATLVWVCEVRWRCHGKQ